MSRSLAHRALRRPLLAATAASLALASLASCSSGSDEPAEPTRSAVVKVPQDAPTITEALTRVEVNGLVLLSPGTYTESVTAETDGITIRGTDRNTVIIDGDGLRPSGIVVTADGVTVQNLTVSNHTFYGVLVTGMPEGGTGRTGSGYEKLDPAKFPPVQRFHVDHVTATNNGLYGIYAFDSQHGILENSYASGSSDSGFYVGQCEDCDITVRNNVAERNAIGFENANASDSVYVIGNRWSGNRIGLTLISSYQEAFFPQRTNVVAGNVITDNTEPDSPAQATGGFGVGVGISGGQDNLVTQNLISGNPQAGILLNNAEDIPSINNRLVDNALADNGMDIADTSAARAPSSGNCVSGVDGLTIGPSALQDAVCPAGTPSGTAISTTELPQLDVPAGIDFSAVARPKPQPSWSGDLESVPTALPATVGAPDLTSITVPSADLLSELTGTA